MQTYLRKHGQRLEQARKIAWLKLVSSDSDEYKMEFPVQNNIKCPEELGNFPELQINTIDAQRPAQVCTCPYIASVASQIAL